MALAEVVYSYSFYSRNFGLFPTLMVYGCISQTLGSVSNSEVILEVDTAIQNATSGLIGVKVWETMEDERVRP